MNFKELESSVIEWAKEKGILEKATTKAQVEKNQEELDELKEAIRNGDYVGIIDGIGDCTVTLIIQAEMNGLSFEECLEYAYNQIKNRTGKMIDGQFKKD